MPKYCKNYKIICTCMTCLNVDCAFSSKTRAEAEVMRGVKLDKNGSEIGTSPSARMERDTKEREARPREPSSKPAAAPTSGYSEAATPGHRLGRDGIWIAIAAVFFAFLVGVGAVIYIMTNVVGKPTTPMPPEAAGDSQDIALVDPSTAVAPAPSPEATQPQPAPTEPVPTQPVEVAAVAPDNHEPQARPRRRVLTPPVDPEVLRQLDQLREQGNKLVQQQNFKEAREVYRKSIEVNPDYYQGYNNLANTYSDTGEPEQAEPIYRQALLIQPDSTHLHYNLALSHFRQEEYPEALKEILWVIQKAPQDIDAYYLAGSTFYKMGDVANAAKVFHAAAAEDPKAAEAYYNLYVVYDAIGQPSVANSYLSQARSLNPEMVASQLKGVNPGV